MSNISDEIDALAIIADTTISELARTRLALAEARRLNAELVEAAQHLLFCPEGNDPKIWFIAAANELKAAIAKAKG